MINLIEKYYKEREGIETIYHNDDGFMMYKFTKEGCLITDTYVLPAKRNEKISHKLCAHVEKICKAKKISLMYCQSDELSNGWDAAHKNILKYGFKEYNKDKTIHYYFKEVF